MDETPLNELQTVPAVGPARAGRLGPLLAGGTILLVVAIVTASAIGAHNDLVALETGIDTQWKQVENQLERQYDLLPKLVTIAQRYAAHERGILQDLSSAREGYFQSSGSDRAARAGDVDLAVIQTLALQESYPDLKADRQFRDLSYEIAGTKNRIAVERKRYNDLVGLYASRLQQIPWRWLAAGSEPRPYYEAPREKLGEPSLDLSSL